MDDRKVWSGSIHVLRHSLRWVDAPGCLWSPQNPL